MNNKGFSLIELIIAMAVGSIVLLLVATMLTRGTSLFREQNDEVNMRNDYQVLRNQLDQIIMEAKTLIVEKQGDDIIIYTGDVKKDSAVREFTTAIADRTTERVITYDKSENSIYISGQYSERLLKGNLISDMVADFDIELDDSSKKVELNAMGVEETYYVNPLRINITLELKEKDRDINSDFSLNLRNRITEIELYTTIDDTQLLNAAESVERYVVK